MSELTPEDSLRINVLLASGVLAIRIDEQQMILQALTPRGEASIPLHPEGRKDQYLRRVRELLSGHALGSPGGFPVHLRNWTRSGQPMGDNLDKLLLLGEPEAVVSVAYSPKVTLELARLAWWAMPVADNARRMLERQWIADSPLGSELAAFLIEHLPFENQPHRVMDTLRIVLHPGLIDAETRRRLWAKTARDNACYIPFLERCPDDLPGTLPAHPAREAAEPLLHPLFCAGNRAAALLLRAWSASGQTFLHAAGEVAARPANQDVAVAAFNAVAAYFAALRDEAPTPPLEKLDAVARTRYDGPEGRALRAALPGNDGAVHALYALSLMDAEVIRPILARTTAEGTLLRRKLEPANTPLLTHLKALRPAAEPQNGNRR